MVIPVPDLSCFMFFIPCVYGVMCFVAPVSPIHTHGSLRSSAMEGMSFSFQQPYTTIHRRDRYLHRQLLRCSARCCRHVEVCTILGICWSFLVYSNNLPRHVPFCHNGCSICACFCCFCLCFSCVGSLPLCVPLDDNCGICQQRLPKPLLCHFRCCL